MDQCTVSFLSKLLGKKADGCGDVVVEAVDTESKTGDSMTNEAPKRSGKTAEVEN